MKKLLSIFLILENCLAFSQNLVPNPSFEDAVNIPTLGSCPHYPSEFYYVKYWSQSLQIQTPDYFHSCDTQFMSVPKNMSGFQEESTGGNAYAGLFTRWGSNTFPQYREIIGVPLIDSLIIGRKYFLSLKVSLSDSSNCASNNIGMLLSTTPLNQDFQVLDAFPNQAHIYATNIIEDTLNWITISGSIVADSSYKYVYIGNLFDNQNTDTILRNIYPCSPFHCPDSNICSAYYYVDDICVSEDSSYCDLSTVITINPYNFAIKVYPNPAIDKIFIETSPLTDLKLSLFNLYGDRLKTALLQGKGAMNVSTVSQGVYILKIRFNNKTYFIKQIIIH